MSDEQRTETDSNHGGFDMTQLAGERWRAPAWHAETIQKEMNSDTPNDDHHGFRGFYEPYKEERLDFDPDAALTDSGFVELVTKGVAPPLWTRIARKPA